MFYDLKWTTNTHMTPFTLTFKAYITISMVFEDLFAPSFFTRPPIFLPVHIRFYPSKWRVDESRHKAMLGVLTHTLTCGQWPASSHTSRHLNPLKQNTLTLYTKSHCALRSPRIYSHPTNTVSNVLLISQVSRLWFRCKFLSKPQSTFILYFLLLHFSSCFYTFVPAFTL